MDALRERKEPIPTKDFKETARIVKEKYCYCCPDIVKEHQKFDEKIKDEATGQWRQSKKFKSVSLTTPLTKKKITFDMGYEMFMAPEIFFHPEFVNAEWRNPLDQIIDYSILTSPVDTRTRLYSNIVLSGGSTLFTNFDKRLE